MARALLHLVGFCALLLMLGASPARAECVPWRQAGDIIRENGLKSGKDVYDRIKQEKQGEIITANLCEENGRFVYRIVLLSAQGKVTNLSVDARSGQF
jgi:uncharacterized membrane protein YkoI